MLHVNHPWEFKGEDSEGYTLVVTDESVNLLLPLKCVLNLQTLEKIFYFGRQSFVLCLGWNLLKLLEKIRSGRRL